MEARSDFIIHFNEKVGKYLVIHINLVEDYFKSNFEMDSPFFGASDFKEIDKYFVELLK